MNACVDIPRQTEHLVDAFSAFIAASDRLEKSHRQLNGEVVRLRQELEERNRALASSLAENEGMRVALVQILDALPCGVAVVEVPADRIVLLNSEGRRLLKFASSELSKGCALPECFQKAIESVFQSPQEGYEQEISLEQAGAKLWLAIRYTRMAVSGKTEAASGSSQVILIIRDVTSHKNAEQDREAARKAFALAEVSAVLAHEIRNPLGSLELLARCLDEDPGLSGESKQCVEHIQAGVRSLSATVNNVLGFHSPGSASSCPLELAPVLKSSLEFIRPLAKQHDVQVELHSDMGQTQVRGEKEGLRQVFLNLLCNALHHTPAGGRIEVLSKVEDLQGGRTAVIEFVDSGSGIRKEDMARIFDPGFSTTGSSGLGLAVCQRIIDQHQGRITVRSEFGQGATFRLEIPSL